MSGGEKKRTSIGVELVTNPSILFLDEPTSGLDSFNAQKIVKLLNKQAKLGKTIIATIHQPNSETFQSFDRLLLLMEGHTIYQGNSDESVSYFEQIGYR
jgi:ABC-type multidrug transport system ATPase subunit